MSEGDETKGIIWAKWRVTRDGSVEVVATYEADADEGYTRREHTYASVDAAADALGPSFRDVVTRSIDAGARSGRWRP